MRVGLEHRSVYSSQTCLQAYTIILYKMNYKHKFYDTVFGLFPLVFITVRFLPNSILPNSYIVFKIKREVKNMFFLF